VIINGPFQSSVVTLVACMYSVSYFASAWCLMLLLLMIAAPACYMQCNFEFQCNFFLCNVVLIRVECRFSAC
jgi:hypothetical protein